MDEAIKRRFPELAMATSREEHVDTPMNVIEGSWPEDLAGYYFWMAPVGNVKAGAPPYPNRPTVIIGDGMVYRLKLDDHTITTSIVKPPDWWADAGSLKGSGYEDMKFEDVGIMRYSLPLGSRNFGNTALLPMKFSKDEGARLLVTYDPARPIEVDPASLETVSPVGYNDEWRAEALNFLPFPPVLSTAHPFFDGHTDEAFMVNWGRSGFSMLETIPGVRAFVKAQSLREQLMWKLLNVFSVKTDPKSPLRRLVEGISQKFTDFLCRLGIDVPAQFLYLVRWDGEGELERWRVMLEDGSPGFVNESMHQVAATRDYVVLMDTNFKLDMDQFLFYRDVHSILNAVLPKPVSEFGKRFLPGDPKGVGATLGRLARFLTASPQGHETILYIIKRSDLVNGLKGSHDGTGEPTVTAKRITFPLGAVHFLADYANPDDTIRIHVGHGCALDLAEWVHGYDQSIYQDGHLPQALQGLIASEVDISRVGCYEIDGSTGMVTSSQVKSSDPLTWGIALYAGQGIPAWDVPPERIESVYWFTFGFWPETISNFIYDLYADYPNRQVALESIRAMDKEDGRPATLFRLDTDTMTFPDAYEFDNTTLLSSPQFAPRVGGTGGQTDGYILCTVWTAEQYQIWVFDAANLKSGPICKVQSDAVKFGFSLHSAFLPDAVPRTSSYKLDPRVDYGPKVDKHEKLKAFFEDKVYPNC